MSEALLQTITGFSIVVLTLLLLTGIIAIFSKVMANANAKNNQGVEDENS